MSWQSSLSPAAATTRAPGGPVSLGHQAKMQNQEVRQNWQQIEKSTLAPVPPLTRTSIPSATLPAVLESAADSKPPITFESVLKATAKAAESNDLVAADVNTLIPTATVSSQRVPNRVSVPASLHEYDGIANVAWTICILFVAAIFLFGTIDLFVYEQSFLFHACHLSAPERSFLSENHLLPEWSNWYCNREVRIIDTVRDWLPGGQISWTCPHAPPLRLILETHHPQLYEELVLDQKLPSDPYKTPHGADDSIDALSGLSCHLTHWEGTNRWWLPFVEIVDYALRVFLQIHLRFVSGFCRLNFVTDPSPSSSEWMGSPETVRSTVGRQNLQQHQQPQQQQQQHRRPSSGGAQKEPPVSSRSFSSNHDNHLQKFTDIGRWQTEYCHECSVLEYSDHLPTLSHKAYAELFHDEQCDVDSFPFSTLDVPRASILSNQQQQQQQQQQQEHHPRTSREYRKNTRVDWISIRLLNGDIENDNTAYSYYQVVHSSHRDWVKKCPLCTQLYEQLSALETHDTPTIGTLGVWFVVQSVDYEHLLNQSRDWRQQLYSADNRVECRWMHSQLQSTVAGHTTDKWLELKRVYEARCVSFGRGGGGGGDGFGHPTARISALDLCNPKNIQFAVEMVVVSDFIGGDSQKTLYECQSQLSLILRQIQTRYFSNPDKTTTTASVGSYATLDLRQFLPLQTSFGLEGDHSMVGEMGRYLDLAAFKFISDQVEIRMPGKLSAQPPPRDHHEDDKSTSPEALSLLDDWSLSRDSVATFDRDVFTRVQLLKHWLDHWTLALSKSGDAHVWNFWWSHLPQTPGLILVQNSMDASLSHVAECALYSRSESSELAEVSVVRHWVSPKCTFAATTAAASSTNDDPIMGDFADTFKQTHYYPWLVSLDSAIQVLRRFLKTQSETLENKEASNAFRLPSPSSHHNIHHEHFARFYEMFNANRLLSRFYWNRLFADEQSRVRQLLSSPALTTTLLNATSAFSLTVNPETISAASAPINTQSAAWILLNDVDYKVRSKFELNLDALRYLAKTLNMPREGTDTFFETTSSSATSIHEFAQLQIYIARQLIHNLDGAKRLHQALAFRCHFDSNFIVRLHPWFEKQTTLERDRLKRISVMHQFVDCEEYWWMKEHHFDMRHTNAHDHCEKAGFVEYLVKKVSGGAQYLFNPGDPRENIETKTLAAQNQWLPYQFCTRLASWTAHLEGFGRSIKLKTSAETYNPIVLYMY